MEKRPYIGKTIFELEAMFNRHDDDVKELKLLASELAKRRVPKARALAVKVDSALAKLASHKLVPTPTSDTVIHNPRKGIPHGSVMKPSVAPELPQNAHDAQPRIKQQASNSEINLTPLRSFSLPDRANDPRAILAAWTAIEALSPQAYKHPKDMVAGEQARVALLAEGIPWGPDARSKPNHKLYFEVFLGAITLDKATEALVSVFGEDEERSRPDGKKAAIGSILIDNKGFVLEDNGIAISSFAWALRPALDMKLESLGIWLKVEPGLKEHLDRLLRRHDDNGSPIPIDLETIHNAHRWLVSQFNVPEYLIELPTFALKVFHHFKAKSPPEPSLLNSFYLEDLGKTAELIETGAAGAGLLRYMGIGRPQEKIDILSSSSAIEPLVAPSLMPAARWPSHGGHPLVLLQQAAVNSARAELRKEPGILGINGPPWNR